MSGILSTLFPWLARGEMLRVGDLAPNFSTTAIVGDQTVQIKLIDYRGRKVVLYFYPKDNTPGCNKEACSFRDGYNQLQAWGIAILGCSIDDTQSHQAFAKKFSLNFPLLLDPDKKIAKAYGADNGIPILGLNRRITYVIGEDGHILKVYPQVDPSKHATQIIHDLGADKPAPTSTASPTASPMPTPKVKPAPARSEEEDDE